MVTYRYCPECGNRVLLGMRFCTKCGTPIPHTEEDAALVPEPSAEEILAETAAAIPEAKPEIKQEMKPEIKPEPETEPEEIREEKPAEIRPEASAMPEPSAKESAEAGREDVPEETTAEALEEDGKREVHTEPEGMPALPEETAASEAAPDGISEEVKAELRMREEEAGLPEESELAAAKISEVITNLEKEKDEMAKTARLAVEEVVAENAAGMPENTEHLVDGTIREAHASAPSARKRKRYDPDTGEPLE